MNQFANRLRARAAELGLAHAEVARRSGLSERRFANYVSGIREPDLATLVRIAAALRTTPNELLGIDESQRPSERSVLIDRLNAAIRGLGERELASVVLQTEALAGPRKKRRGANSRTK